MQHTVRSGAQRASAPGEESLRLERLVAELSAGFISLPAASIDSAIVDGLRRIVEALHIDRSTLSSISPDTAQFHSMHSWVVDGLMPVPANTSSREFPWVLARMRMGMPIVFSQLDELPPEASVDSASFRRIELRSHVALPVVVAGELVAVLGFATLRDERTWSDELVGRLRLIAEIFASALARKRAHDDVERALGFERLLVDISATMLRGQPGGLDAAISAALRGIGEFLRVDRVLLRSLNFDGSRFETTHLWVASGVDAPPYVIERATAPVLFERISGGRVVALSSLDDLPPEADTDRELLRRLGIRSGLVAPLAVDGIVVGALSLSSVRAERVWPETLIPRVQLIGEVFASVLTRERHATQMRDAQTETAQYRERLAHLVRVHTVGEMSAAIAHEVNQPLVAIENYAQAARRRLASESGIENAKLVELLEKIGQQAARAGDVMKRLRSIVRKHESEVTQFDLGSTIASAINLVEMESRLSDIRIESAVAPGLPSVLADEIQIQQVVLNLARNALEAMDWADTDEKVLRFELQPVGEHDVVVRVIDRGKGVSPDDERHMFEPFHSTKVTGLGIGLAICRSIVEAHGGRLSYLPNPIGGAIFEFTLPIADGRCRAMTAPIVSIVDDDDAVRDSIAELMSSVGLRAATFRSAQEFLDSYDARQPGCLVLDVRMAHMSGPALQEKLLAMGATIPIVFISGHGDIPVAIKAIKAGAVDFVQKPYRDQQLLDSINDALQRDTTARDSAKSVDGFAARMTALTDRERNVLDLVVKGLSSKAIAKSLGISYRTVEVHRSHILEKLGVRSVPELIHLANR